MESKKIEEYRKLREYLYKNIEAKVIQFNKENNTKFEISNIGNYDNEYCILDNEDIEMEDIFCFGW